MCAATVLSIGTFDGVHRGHQALVAKARETAGSDGRVVVLCFDPHPLCTLRPDQAPPRLSSFEQRRDWLMDIGVDHVERLKPTTQRLSQSATDFVDELCARYEPVAFVEGPDFHFGKGRTGNNETLRQLGQSRGFAVHLVSPVQCELTDQSVIRASSSMLRWLIRHGRVRDAGLMADRMFELRGLVVRGHQRGRDFGFPTANMTIPADQLLPRDGVYAGIGNAPDGQEYPAAISIGTNPTFGDQQRTCEAHLIGFDGAAGQYDWNLKLRFVDWIRDQITYDSVEPLIEQIRRDCARVATIVSRFTPTDAHA